MMPYCKAHGIGFIPFSPLHQGDLAKPVSQSTTRRNTAKGGVLERALGEEDQVIISRVEEISKRRNWKMNEVGLAWIDAKVTSPLVGCNTVSSADG